MTVDISSDAEEDLIEGLDTRSTSRRGRTVTRS